MRLGSCRLTLAACGCLLAFGGVSGLASANAGARPSTVRPSTARPGSSVNAVDPTTTAQLSAAFSPYKLGHRTTLQFTFAFSSPAGQMPPPLVEMQLRYPRGLNLFLNDLGIRRCSEETLEAGGPTACPRDSVMGYGVVRTGIVLGDTPIEESSPITIFRAPEQAGHFALLFFAEGSHPVITNVIFSGLLLSAQEPFGGQVRIGVPLVETLPGAPYVSVLHLHATIGPRELTYYRNVSGVSLAYKPRGILLPPTCHSNGFPFAANFVFSDGTQARTRTTVPCSKGATRHRRQKARHP